MITFVYLMLTFSKKYNKKVFKVFKTLDHYLTPCWGQAITKINRESSSDLLLPISMTITIIINLNSSNY